MKFKSLSFLLVSALIAPIIAHPSHVDDGKIDCPKGRCLASTEYIAEGAVVEKFEGIPATHEYKAGMDQPRENRHIKWLGRDTSGKDIWIFVTSNAAYINHSCNPNCIVNEKWEIVTLRPVMKGEELTISYNSRSKNNFPLDMVWKPEWNFRCFCEEHNCQKFIDRFIK